MGFSRCTRRKGGSLVQLQSCLPKENGGLRIKRSPRIFERNGNLVTNIPGRHPFKLVNRDEDLSLRRLNLSPPVIVRHVIDNRPKRLVCRLKVGDDLRANHGCASFRFRPTLGRFVSGGFWSASSGKSHPNECLTAPGISRASCRIRISDSPTFCASSRVPIIAIPH